ncbi:MAG: hypothetical protein B6247_07715 [Candidatus Parabeggiatoa sp. nov. 2]|nr:MAG: hypothetical protein B6247_07715 [Beggiatoa sp. 4572_84]
MKIKTIRGQGHIQRPDIISPLTCEISVALWLGQTEMDKGENWLPVTQQIPFDPDVSVGDSVESYDSLQSSAWRGIVTSIQHGLNAEGQFITELGLLRKPY